MNKLLIHNDNIAYKEIFEENLKLPPIENIDNNISENIIPKIKSSKCEIIFIKDNLSTNYLELYGIRVAYHIRLSKELGNKRYLPIVILSDVDSYILNKLDPMANIIFTKNIFIIPNTKDAIEKISQKEFKNLTQEEYKKDFLNKIEVEPPKDYLSHHSIANEWSIYRWGEFLNVESEAIKKNKAKIENLLYFKYLLSKNPIKKKNGIKFVPKIPEATGSILYIDDQWDQGWSDIFHKYFSKIENINFNTFEYNYKDKDELTILNDIQTKVNSINPDMVILDLRLTQNDHKKDIKIDSLMGIKTLKKIKNINKGIQVIMLTASSKSIILEKLYEYKILGYIKKEHPNDLSIDTKDNFKKLKKLIDAGLEKKYLKDIWVIQQSILKLTMFNNKKYDKIKKEVEFIFEILDSSMDNKLQFTMLTIYKILEIIKDLYIDNDAKYFDNEQEIKAIYSHDEKYIDIDKQVFFKDRVYLISKEYAKNYYYSTNNKINALMYEKLHISDKALFKSIDNISYKRNKYIHPNSGKKIDVSKDDIKQWFKALKQILFTIDKQNKSVP